MGACWGARIRALGFYVFWLAFAVRGLGFQVLGAFEVFRRFRVVGFRVAGLGCIGD